MIKSLNFLHLVHDGEIMYLLGAPFFSQIETIYLFSFDKYGAKQ